MQGPHTITTPIYCNSGTSIVPVTTTQNSGESDQDFFDRHLAAVAAKVAECS